jgi:hypothetical protein
MISNLRSVHTVGIHLRHREGFFAEKGCFRWFDLHGGESGTGRIRVDVNRIQSSGSL